MKQIKDLDEIRECGPEIALRDWFAGMALQGILACPSDYRGVAKNMEGRIALAYKCADAMLKERENAP